MPLFNKSDLRADLNAYLDIVTDYTADTKSNVKQMEKAKVIKTYGLTNTLESNLKQNFRNSGGNSLVSSSTNHVVNQLNKYGDNTTSEVNDSMFITAASTKLPTIETRGETMRYS